MFLCSEKNPNLFLQNEENIQLNEQCEYLVINKAIPTAKFVWLFLNTLKGDFCKLKCLFHWCNLLPLKSH